MLQQQSLEMRRRFTLAGGDDYELCFTAPTSKRDAVLGAALAAGTTVTRIGVIEAGTGVRLLDGDDHPLDLHISSFDHFTSP
jgi:thiamine-monophosphate kinase